MNPYWNINIPYSQGIQSIYKYGILFAIKNKVLFLGIYILNGTLAAISFLYLQDYRIPRWRKAVLAFLIIYTQIIMLILASLILYNSPLFPYSFRYFGYSDYIIRNSHINQTRIWYHNWPTFPIFGAVLYKISNVSSFSIVLMIPVFLTILGATYVFNIGLVLTRKIGFATLWTYLFILLNWSHQIFYTSQLYAYVFYLAILTIIVTKKEILKYNWQMILAIIFATLVTSHILMSLYVLSLLIITTLVKILMDIFPHNPTKRSKILSFIVPILMFIGWNSLWASKWVFSRVNRIVVFLRTLGSIEASKSMIDKGSHYHEIYSTIRLISSVFVILASVLSICVLYRYKEYFIKKQNSTPHMFHYLILAISIVIPYGIALLGTHGGESFIRAYLYSLVGATFYISTLLKFSTFSPSLTKKRYISTLFLVILMSLPAMSLINNYYAYSTQYVSTVDIQGVQFFYTHSRPLSISIVQYGTIFEWKFQEKYIFKLNTLEISKADYLWITPLGIRYYSFLGPLGSSEEILVKKHYSGYIITSEQFNKIYTTNNIEKFEIYVRTS